MKTLRKIAKESGETLQVTEGGSHTKVVIGERKSTVPRPSEINEYTAQGIFSTMKGK